MVSDLTPSTVYAECNTNSAIAEVTFEKKPKVLHCRGVTECIKRVEKSIRRTRSIGGGSRVRAVFIDLEDESRSPDKYFMVREFVDKRLSRNFIKICEKESNNIKIIYYKNIINFNKQNDFENDLLVVVLFEGGPERVLEKLDRRLYRELARDPRKFKEKSIWRKAKGECPESDSACRAILRISRKIKEMLKEILGRN